MPKRRQPPRAERIKPRGDAREGLLAVDSKTSTDPDTVKLEKARQKTNESRRRH